KVEGGLWELEARRQNAPYLCLVSRRRPWVHAKWAMTLDGKIASKSGDSKWISNEASRRRVHELRGRMDAIVVGIGTALADDPLLTARPPGPRTALRVVLDRQARLPLASQLVQTAQEAPLLVATSPQADRDRTRHLSEHGVEVLTLSAADRAEMVVRLLEDLGRRRFCNILVEGGSAVLGSFHDANELDELHIFVAPKL